MIEEIDNTYRLRMERSSANTPVGATFPRFPSSIYVIGCGLSMPSKQEIVRFQHPAARSNQKRKSKELSIFYLSSRTFSGLPSTSLHYLKYGFRKPSTDPLMIFGTNLVLGNRLPAIQSVQGRDSVTLTQLFRLEPRCIHLESIKEEELTSLRLVYHTAVGRRTSGTRSPSPAAAMTETKSTRSPRRQRVDPSTWHGNGCSSFR
jgi:hypothetical protein